MDDQTATFLQEMKQRQENDVMGLVYKYADNPEALVVLRLVLLEMIDIHQATVDGIESALSKRAN